MNVEVNKLQSGKFHARIEFNGVAGNAIRGTRFEALKAANECREETERTFAATARAINQVFEEFNHATN